MTHGMRKRQEIAKRMKHTGSFFENRAKGSMAGPVFITDIPKKYEQKRKNN